MHPFTNPRYHINCVKMSATELDKVKEYCCPVCETKNQKTNVRDKTRTESSADKRKGDEIGEKEEKEEDEEDKTKMRKVRREGKTSNAAVNIILLLLHLTICPLQLLYRNYDASRDRTRQTVREGLTKAICLADPEQSTDKVSELVRHIEEAMFAALAETAPTTQGGLGATRCGSRYKAKYRSLQFNLKDPKNNNLRGRLLNGELSAEQLVAMEAHEMANEEMVQVIRHVREASLSKLMVPEGAIEAGSFVKKTHKGEESLPMAPLDQATTVVPEPPAQSMIKTDRPPRAETATRSEPIWMGKIYVPELGRVPSQGRFVAASTGGQTNATLRKLLPHNIHVSGRIPVKTAQDYVQQIWAGSNTRNVLLFSLSSLDAAVGGKMTTEQPAPTVSDLIAYLLQNDRWAVVAHDPQRGIRDFYLAPANDPAQFAMPLPPQCTLPALMGILVVAKDGRATTSPVQDLYDPQKPIYS